VSIRSEMEILSANVGGFDDFRQNLDERFQRLQSEVENIANVLDAEREG
jgi:hypothetical protein